MADRVCAYAVAAGREKPLRVRGVAGERLRSVRIGGIELVIGDVARPPRPATATLRRYDGVMRELMQIYASVVPARFGTCAATEDEIVASVRDRRAVVARALRLVRHRVQMTIRIFDSDEGQSRLGPGSESESQSEYLGTQGTEYLQRRAADLQIPGADGLRTAAARWIRAERRERRGAGRLAGTLYHLVPRGSVASYQRAVERAALDGDLTTIVSGPWPPYAFTE